jgi:sterol desaturase/sphingolipid hydroxylase (fatty acid hydroxylase superfamily)
MKPQKSLIPSSSIGLQPFSVELWAFHAVHHSVETLDWLAGSRSHVTQVFIERTLVMLALYFLGADKAALDIYVAIL